MLDSTVFEESRIKKTAGLVARKRQFRNDTLKIAIWSLLASVHPNRKEIIKTIRALNDFGASSNLIAAALGLQGWKSFFGDRDWTQLEVQRLLQWYGSKKELDID